MNFLLQRFERKKQEHGIEIEGQLSLQEESAEGYFLADQHIQQKKTAQQQIHKNEQEIRALPILLCQNKNDKEAGDRHAGYNK